MTLRIQQQQPAPVPLVLLPQRPLRLLPNAVSRLPLRLRRALCLLQQTSVHQTTTTTSGNTTTGSHAHGWQGDLPSATKARGCANSRCCLCGEGCGEGRCRLGAEGGCWGLDGWEAECGRGGGRGEAAGRGLRGTTAAAMMYMRWATLQSLHVFVPYGTRHTDAKSFDAAKAAARGQSAPGQTAPPRGLRNQLPPPAPPPAPPPGLPPPPPLPSPDLPPALRRRRQRPASPAPETPYAPAAVFRPPPCRPPPQHPRHLTHHHLLLLLLLLLAEKLQTRGWARGACRRVSHQRLRTGKGNVPTAPA